MTLSSDDGARDDVRPLLAPARQGLDAFLTSLPEPPRSVRTTIREQLGELIETRHPGRTFEPCELAAAVDAHIGDCPLECYGNFVHYPWSGRVVQVLPEAEYRELRTSRNRNKITVEEQERLASLRIAIVGLSVGRASVVTLALEGVGRSFRLADFDTIDLSNMNRLQVGVHDLGVNKAVSAARELYEIDPYLEVEVIHRRGDGRDDGADPRQSGGGDGGRPSRRGM